MRAWWEYPYATGGPWAVGSYLGMAACSLAAVALLPRGWQWVALVALFVGQPTVVKFARSRFERRRNLTGAFHVPETKSQQTVYVAAIASPFVAQLAVGFEPGWIGVLSGVTFTIYELYLHAQWVEDGRPGDARWARRWRPRG